jgi:VIT1/CCC1 family predicted Fe2+/Mn2+ transporter
MNNIIQDNKTRFIQSLRDVVFGLEDGMVSTLGAITGIAIGSQSRFSVMLAGLVIIAVESISMGIGSYVSNKSERDYDICKLREQKLEIRNQPHFEKQEMLITYKRDGWPDAVALQMADAVMQNKKLMLLEKAYHELQILPQQTSNPQIRGIFMFFSYVIGGAVPLLAYLILPLSLALPISIVLTLIGLFSLGVFTSVYTKQSLIKSGFKMFLIGSLALVAGILMGELARRLGIEN